MTIQQVFADDDVFVIIMPTAPCTICLWNT